MRFAATTRRLMLVVSLLTCGIPEPRALAQVIDGEQDRAVAAIQRMGGKVVRDRAILGHPVVHVDLRMTRVTDSDLAVLEHLRGIQSVYLSASGITDAGLVHLEKLTRLRRLDLDFNPITDAGLAHLEGLINLRVLDIHGTKITTAGVERLERKLPRVIVDRSVDTPILLQADGLGRQLDDRADPVRPGPARRVPPGPVGGRPR
jgi:Leucine Rich repeat